MKPCLVKSQDDWFLERKTRLKSFGKHLCEILNFIRKHNILHNKSNIEKKLIAQAKKQPLSWDKCPFHHYIGTF